MEYDYEVLNKPKWGILQVLKHKMGLYKSRLLALTEVVCVMHYAYENKWKMLMIEQRLKTPTYHCNILYFIS